MGMISAFKARKALKKATVEKLLNEAPLFRKMREENPRFKISGDELRREMDRYARENLCGIKPSYSTDHHPETPGVGPTRELLKVGKYVNENPDQTRYYAIPVNTKYKSRLPNEVIENRMIIDTKKGYKPIGLFYKQVPIKPKKKPRNL